jgi:hypothetical protein
MARYLGAIEEAATDLMRIYGAATQAAQLQVRHRSAADDRPHRGCKQTSKQTNKVQRVTRLAALLRCAARRSGFGLAICCRATVKAALEQSHECALACTHTLRIRTRAHARTQLCVEESFACCAALRLAAAGG